MVCKAWKYALDPRRWPLRQLVLDGTRRESFTGKVTLPTALPLALWMQHVRPGIEDLDLELRGILADFATQTEPLGTRSPTVEAVHGALLALQPTAVSHTMW